MIATVNLTVALNEKLFSSTIKDGRYKNSAKPLTTNKFGPSGSSIIPRMNLEIKTEIIYKQKSEVLLSASDMFLNSYR